MATFFVNNQAVTVSVNQKLMTFLRDELRLTSVKDGCSEGACGTCTVLIDGKPTRACIPTTDKMEGKHILTVEGLSPFEQQVYTYAFGEAGAVQCGFCIPGMVICTKALLDTNPSPTRAQAAYAIRTNICRCTGYVKIIDAMMLAAECIRNSKIPDQTAPWKIGNHVHRVDVAEKVLGTGLYTDDVYLDGMVYASAVRSAHPRAKVLAIHSEEALALEGVVAVFTAEDVPGINKVGHLTKDWDSMIPVGGITRYLGDAICLVVAESKTVLEQAKKLVQVDYEVLPHVTSPRDAMLHDAPAIHNGGNLYAHKHIQRGNAAMAIAKSKHILTKSFSTPFTDHAFMEPECAVAFPDGDGVMVWSSDQSVYDTQHEIMGYLGLPGHLVKVENLLVGGGFGGKEDMSVQHHAALVAYLTKRPVKIKFSRAESLLIHPKRHPMEMEFSLGCDENGIIQGVAANIIADTGAYASLGGPVLERACTHASGPYNYQNFQIDGYAYYTNNPPGGAFRGFGVTQSCFAIETLLNQMADVVGISTWEIRYRNAIRPGQELPNGQIVDDSTGLVETLEAVKPYYDAAKTPGIACAMKNAGVGVGLPDTGRVRLLVKEGVVHLYSAATCMGQGLSTVLQQMLCDQAELTPAQVVVHRPNTSDSPDSGTSSGSRQTLVTGEACRRATTDLCKSLETATLEDLEGKEFWGIYATKTDPLGANVPNPVSHVAYGYATQLCTLDEGGKIERIVAAHDVGRVINPKACEGQIEGGVVMSMGFALTEDFPLKDCKPTGKLGTIGLFKANQIPEITSIIVEKPGLNVAHGAIGIGEITSIPTAPAIADAYFRYDGELRTQLPLRDTPYGKKK